MRKISRPNYFIHFHKYLFVLVLVTLAASYSSAGIINKKSVQRSNTDLKQLVKSAQGFVAQKKYDEAFKEAEKAAEIAEKQEDYESLTVLYALMGDLQLYQLQRPDLGANYHRKAYENHRLLLKKKASGYQLLNNFIEHVALPAYIYVRQLPTNKIRNRKALRSYTALNSEFTDYISDLAIKSNQSLKKTNKKLDEQKASTKQLFLEKMILSGTLEEKERAAIALEDSLEQTELELKAKAITLLNEKAKRIEAERQQAVLAQRAAEADNQRLFTWFVTVALGLSIVLAGLLLVNWKRTKKVNKTLNLLNADIQHEKDKSDKLLLNILPHDVANELKLSGKVQPKNYEMATVMFTDFKDFTNIAERQTAEETVQQLNRFFEVFDEIIARFKLEKIKTIGDGYLCAGGIPVANTSNPQDTVRAGLAMIEAMKTMQEDDPHLQESNWELRIGIHTGPIVAGVIGKNKFAYDIWGDTVNLASRLESSGMAGKVNISEETYRYVKDDFRCVHRGKVKAKSKGEIDMYFVEPD